MKGIDRGQLWAILRLGWRLSNRRWQRQSPLLGGVAILLKVLAAGSAVLVLVLAYIVGVSTLPALDPRAVLFVWDGILVAFVVVWVAGLLMQLQLGGATISIDKLMHMPVSPAGAFLLNFASSQLRVSLVIFLALMLGLAVASVASLGVGQLILVPLVLATVAMIAAVTYQLQSWLGRIVGNKRRRGTVVAVAVVVFILLANAPNLIFNLGGRDGSRLPGEGFDAATMVRWTQVANMALPPGWLALGAQSANKGVVWPGALAIVGLLGITALSLRRSYRKTLRALSHADSPPGRTPKAADSTHRPRQPTSSRSRPRRFWQTYLEPLVRRLPEHARAVAWATMRLWRRSPMGKMIMLSPILLVMLYLVLFSRFGSSEWMAHFSVLAMLGFMIMMSFNLFANQFGQDAGGFRISVMLAISPRDLLLGKNLALAPFVLVVGLPALVVLQWMTPLPLGHFVAHVAQLGVLYFIGCLLGNAFSIRAPRAMSTTSMMVPNSTATMFLASLLVLVVFTLFILPLALVLWIERSASAAGWPVPVYLAFSVLELVLVAGFYRRRLTRQGHLLGKRLEFVLERVTEAVD